MENTPCLISQIIVPVEKIGQIKIYSQKTGSLVSVIIISELIKKMQQAGYTNIAKLKEIRRIKTSEELIRHLSDFEDPEALPPKPKRKGEIDPFEGIRNKQAFIKQLPSIISQSQLN